MKGKRVYSTKPNPKEELKKDSPKDIKNRKYYKGEI